MYLELLADHKSEFIIGRVMSFNIHQEALITDPILWAFLNLEFFVLNRLFINVE